MTSKEYRKATKTFGAGTCEYYGQNLEYKVAIALLRTDLKNLNDIRHTTFLLLPAAGDGVRPHPPAWQCVLHGFG